jgi:hypothetical protein
MRFAEIALMVLPFAVFAVWRLIAPTGEPPRTLVISVAAVTVAMVVLLVVLWYKDAEPPDAVYVPARQEQGRIVPPVLGTAPR